MPASVVIADTQELAIAGLRHILADTEIKVIAEVKTLQGVWDIVETDRPDVLIIDHSKIRAFNADDLLTLHETYASVSLLVISADDNKEKIMQLLRSGVTAYLTKDCSREEIIMALRAAIRKEKFFCHKVLEILLENNVKKEETDNAPAFITEREMQIIQLIVKGHSTQKIAQELNLSHHTINSHRKNILKKLNIRSPAELVIYAIDNGLLELNKENLKK